MDPASSSPPPRPVASTTFGRGNESKRFALISAVFLMATAASGPGFITQTATFTQTMGAAFAFGILASVIIDYIVQINIWRIVAATRMRASDIANAAIPGSGYLLAFLVILGGLFFNIANVAGAGLGLNALLGLDPKIGGALSALLAIGIFLNKRAGGVMDRTMIALGTVKIALILFVAYSASPPVGEALRQTVWPDTIDFPTITTIVGGTVGGYLTYAGAHRLLDKGLVGRENIPSVTKAALNGITVTGIMRFILFLGILGVVSSGVTLDLSGRTANPAAQAFGHAVGEFGFRVFGLIFWAAGMSSIIGAAYTSVSFMTAFRPGMGDRARSWATVVFIAVSLAVFLLIGTTPAALLVFVGGFNGLVLPIGLTIILYAAWARRDLMGDYRHPAWLFALGVATAALTWWMGYRSIGPIFAFLGR
ncbi:NRAMP family divalent metal transporter [Aureimonas sp. Leaf324]|uniref:NRAMP family divalent metal transporter n=1 Tax=Aureimonas sp. Leaf324 TaxID=1736336 RepID=UPI000B1E832D|nr:NRAMP family divalent metal transporter [Aureimonas sp. Leaf324]